ncbi:MAG: CpaF family protein [Candidatus Melainabacteria bacterium]|nr:CpaF family protein [Candidatus Melainabacteria bacterium]MBI3308550.1 CpaF family protein [Candidatus Melainabacteria bacterium]
MDGSTHNLSKHIFSKKEDALESPDSPAKQTASHKPSSASSSNIEGSYKELKKRLHSKLLDELDMSKLDEDVSNEGTRKQIVSLIETLLQEDGIPLALSDRNRLIEELIDDILGLGPIEPLLRDTSINDVLVNGPNKVYVERKGVLELTKIKFDDDAHLMRVINRIVSGVGRRVDESSPMVDARLKDGSRVNAIILPLSIDGAALSIRKFSAKKLILDDLVKYGAITENMAEMLKMCVRCRMNIVVSGGTGSGKTTFLNALSNFIPSTERVVTIEDAAELQLQGEHVVRLETRPPNLEGKGEVTQRDLVKNALRMRPERIILGEIRSGEALDLLQAMNTGHDGSMGTLHANTTRDAFSRLETMCLMSGLELPQRAIREQISSAVHLICQLNRFSDGSRRVTQISEVTGMENGVISTQDVFVFEQKGVDENNKVKGIFKPSGIRPKFSMKVEAMGYKLPPSMFNPV